MPPAAALALLLIAGSFAAAQRGNRRESAAAAFVAAAIAVLTLVEEFARVPLGMQIEWLAPARGGEVPSRMAPAACLTLLLLALAAPLPRHARVFGLPGAGLAAGAAGAVAFFALLGLSLRL